MSLPIGHGNRHLVLDARRCGKPTPDLVPALRLTASTPRPGYRHKSHLLQYQCHSCAQATATTSCVEKADPVESTAFDSSLYSTVLQPSKELTELCSRQLEAVYEFLGRCGTTAASNVRSTVYVRCADIISGNSLQLRKAVSLLPGQSPSLPSQYDDDNTLQLAGPDGQISVEDYLLQQNVLQLPNSPTVVLPLCESGVLVGLLVLERNLPTPDLRSWPQTPPLGDGSASLFTEDELWFFQRAVPSLAAACAMELRVSMTQADVSARQQAMAALLQGTRGPLTALRTFGSMLLPRLHEGEPDRDLASNMVVQSKQLEEVVHQLEAALRPDPSLHMATPLDSSPESFDHLALTSPDYPPYPPFSPHSSATLHDTRDTRVPPTLLTSPASSLWPPPTDVPGSTWRAPSSHPELPPLPSSAPPTASSTPSPPFPALATFTSSQPQPITSSSPPPPAPQSLTIHRGIADPPLPTPSDSCIVLIPPTQPTSNIDLDVDSLSHSSLSHPTSMPFPTSNIQASSPASFSLTSSPSPTSPSTSKTLNTTTSSRTSLSPSPSTSTSSPTTRTSSPPSPSSSPSPSSAECHLADALVHILTAAHNLCTARGQQMVVGHPLRIATTPSSSSHSSRHQHHPSNHSPPLAPQPPQLLPRPVRPLWAAVSPLLVTQAVSYILEVVLASCTTGGMVGITAQRTDGPPPGVQLIILFTGTVRIVPPSGSAEWQMALGGGRGEVAAGASSLEHAQNLLQRVGGRISITYPCKLRSRRSREVEVGTCVEVWLPAVKQQQGAAEREKGQSG